MQRPGQEVPVAQDLRQEAREARLHHINNDHEDNQHNDGHTDADQDLPAGHRQAKYSQRGYQEAQDKIEDGKPAVFGRTVPQASSQPDWQPHEGDWIPNYDTHDVEEEMAKCNLEKQKKTRQMVSH